MLVGRGLGRECHSGPVVWDRPGAVPGGPGGGGEGRAKEKGGGEGTGTADNGKFLTGQLREIAGTAPYMHDGSLPTLAEVIDFYRRGGGASSVKDPRIVPLDVTDDDARDLGAFLHSLTPRDATPCPRPLAGLAAG